MKFRLVSDLHLEFAPIKLPGNTETLLLAGDIIPAAYLLAHRTDKESRKYRGFMDKFAEETLPNFGNVYHICGNHEHYHGVYDYSKEIIQEYYDRKKINAKVLENEHVKLAEGIRLFGATLWTDFRRGDPMILNCARLGMNDYRLIKYGDGTRRFQPELAFNIHTNTMLKLKEAVEEYKDDHWVVMTHMGPSWKSVDHKRYGNDPLNYCYVTDLDQFIMDHPQINIWCHGHTHTSYAYNIGETVVVCNPRGYAHYATLVPENPTFNDSLEFELAPNRFRAPDGKMVEQVPNYPVFFEVDTEKSSDYR